jgi:soluble lytic murein transglycosylase-like protein
MERYAMILQTLLIALVLSQDAIPLQEVIEKRAFVLRTDLEKGDSAEIATVTAEVSKRFELDSALILALMEFESRYSKKAKSKKGCEGLTQVSRSTGRYISKKLQLNKYSLTSVKDSILIGIAYLKELIIQFKDPKAAVTIYNKGIVKWLDKPKTSGYSKAIMKRYRYLAAHIKKEEKNNFCSK